MPRKLLEMLAPATDGSRATVAQEVVLLLVSMPGRTLTAFGEIGCKIRLRKLLLLSKLLLLLLLMKLLLPLGPFATALLPLMVAVSAAAKICKENRQLRISPIVQLSQPSSMQSQKL
jgi:hypothetical protein